MNNNNEQKTALSVAIITKNEEERLPACLQSVSFANEIIVVDSGSTDKTVDVAKAHGARVYIESWKGFSEQKQLAVNKCTNQWVLVLDADERVPKETARLIHELLKKTSNKTAAYSLRRKNYLHGRWIKHCGWWPNSVLRLVDKSKGSFDGKTVHESWFTTHPIVELDAFIEHLSFRNYSELIAKMDHYSTLGAEDLFKKNKKTHVMKPILRSVWMFFKTYFLELGILDGFDGLVISIMNAGGSFFKYAKHRELESTRK